MTKLLLAIALCVHWFNPLVWVMYVHANRDMELSCDETVVRTFGETTKSVYAMTLIDMEEKKSKITPLFNSFSKNAIEERITAIMKMKKVTALGVTAALLLVGGTLTAFATSAANVNSRSASAMTTETDSSFNGLTEKEQEAEHRKAMADAMKVYEPFGLTYDEKTGQLFYQGEKVRDFYDEQAGVGQSMTDGSVDLYAAYENGKLVGINKRSQAEFDRNTAEKEAVEKEIAEKRKELGVPDGADFSYEDDSISNMQSTTDTVSAEVLSYTDKMGKVRLSADDGKTWMSEEDFEKAYPTPKVVWWTYDEYKAWLAKEKKSLQSIIGEKAWNPSDGWYVWTQEKVNNTIAMYEKTLEDIKNGIKVSKTVDGSDEVMMSYNPGKMQTTTGYVKQVKDDKMAQSEADKILDKANAMK